mmetsp:Transcript_34534/g.55110  ORF Transcript_34534/g.55110 Transcript_34534/m.55110 type:complete len:222 (-) Transcript_34534:616-1281(-)
MHVAILTVVHWHVQIILDVIFHSIADFGQLGLVNVRLHFVNLRQRKHIAKRTRHPPPTIDGDPTGYPNQKPRNHSTYQPYTYSSCVNLHVYITKQQNSYINKQLFGTSPLQTIDGDPTGYPNQKPRNHSTYQPYTYSSCVNLHVYITKQQNSYINKQLFGTSPLQTIDDNRRRANQIYPSQKTLSNNSPHEYNTSTKLFETSPDQPDILSSNNRQRSNRTP